MTASPAVWLPKSVARLTGSVAGVPCHQTKCAAPIVDPRTNPPSVRKIAVWPLPTI